jgi:acyl-homoserine-lactone acylase
MLQSFIGILLGILLFTYSFLCFDARGQEVTIYRDTYGVPHIYGDSEEAVAFGQGYAQAEDRLETVLKSYLKAQGKMAKVFGEQWLESDYIHRVCRHAEIAREKYDELSPDVRKFIEHFVAGIRQYMSEHPETVPSWAEAPEPYHVVAFSRYFIWGWPLGDANGDLRRGREDRPKPDNGRGSNQWVISRRRSAKDCVIALIDPHLGWRDEQLFHEAHLHGGDLNAFGFMPVGGAGIGLGHNDYLSWACTTGGPDTADVYEEEINPDNPLQYSYDGEWRDMVVETIEIEVKTDSGVETVRREVHRTHHGPIVERYNSKAYTFKLAYDDEVLLSEQLYKMGKAKNLAEFLNAVGMLQFMPQNVMYGDVYGNMYYVRTGRVPIRPDGYDWRRPVPGNTSATEWLGIHPQEDLVQILNPPAGFMQNCNISPGTMTLNSPLTPDRYKPYIYNDYVDRSNTRGRRFMEIMGEMDVVTEEDALRIATDVKIQGVGVWQQALVNAYKAHAEEFKDLAEAVDIIEKWDHQADIDSTGMTLFFAWWVSGRQMGDAIPGNLIREGKPVPEDAQKAMLTALKQATSYMQKTYGSIGVPWGNVYRLRRGDKTWPLAGVAEHGLVTLRAVGADDPDENGIMYANGGQLCTTVIFLGDPVRSYSVVPYGQSEFPDSPHYSDQAEKLFSKRLLRPTWYQKEELMEHVESKKTLSVP